MMQKLPSCQLQMVSQAICCMSHMMRPLIAGEGPEHLRSAESAVVRARAERGGRPGG